MKSYFKLGVLICVIALSIGAYAGSITALNYSGRVGDVPNVNVHGTLSFDPVAGATYSFVGNSTFGAVSGTVTQAQPGSNLLINAMVDGRAVSYNMLPNSLDAGFSSPAGMPITAGQWWNEHHQQVPEGGTQISYLLASGLVLFAGIFLAGKQRRRSAEN